MIMMAIETIGIVLACGILILATLYRYLTSTFDYFEKQGIPGPKPVPFFGTWWKMWTKNQNEEEVRNVKKYGKIYGTFDGRVPNLVVADPDLVKSILVTDLENFRNRGGCTLKQEVLRRNVGLLLDEEWKKVRAVMMPSFSNDKLKRMVPLVQKTIATMTKNLKKSLEASEKVNIQSVMTSFLIDTIALSLFGIELDSFNKEDHPLVTYSKRIFKIEHSDSIFSVFPAIFSSFASLDNLVLRKEAAKYFTALCCNIIKERQKEDKPQKNDFIDLLLEAAEDEKQTMKQLEETEKPPALTDDVLAAQVLLVMLAGYVTSRDTLALSVHSLATNSEVQELLHTKLTAHLEENKDEEEISFEKANSVEYLDMFLSEVLRMYPAEYRLERYCTTSTEYDNVKIQKGSKVSVATYAMHHNEEFYPEPETFAPVRFSADNKASRNEFTYLPFGQGPQNCLGLRFAMLIEKLALAHLVRDFKFSAIEETKNPPEVLKGVTYVYAPKNIIVAVEARN